MRRLSSLIILLLLGLPLAASCLDVSWTPVTPSRDDVIEIELQACTQGGVLHWGVNAKGNKWKPAIPSYRPTRSAEDGVATRTPLSDPDADGICRVTLGPFNDTQRVGTVDFAIQWDDGSWDNIEGEDYHIPIFQGRISVEPRNLTVNDVITVTAERSKPGGELRWGVNASHGHWEPPHPLYRPQGTILSDDGLAVDSPMSDPDTHNLSTIQLGPFDQPDQVVTSLHMAVHWDKDWDSDAGRNYNFEIDLNGGEPRLSFETPADGQLLTDQLEVTVASEGDEPVTLWLNGEPMITLLDSALTWRAPLSDLVYGPHELLARRGEKGHVAMAITHFWRIPHIETSGLPPAAHPGATEHPDGTVTFTLLAPGKRFVALVGDFNDWDPMADVMHYSTNGTWWIQREMPPGHYEYQYLVDGHLRLADPYATDVEWTDDDGVETYHADLARSVLHVGAEPYVWHDQGYERPPLENLLIYEFFIEDFCPGEGYTGVIARLDYIKALGVNAIEPLPVTEYSDGGYWGYNPSYHFAPESYYGTPEELKRLVDEAHERGLAVVFDMVLNHMDGKAPLHLLYGTDYDQSPYFHLFKGENWGMPDLDQESEVFKQYVADALRHWLIEYHGDGFRYDATRWVEWEGYNAWGASWFAYAGKQADPTSYHIAEHLPTDPDLMNLTEMDTGWHAHFRWRIRDMIRNAELHAEEFRRIMDPLQLGFSNNFQRLTYLESHDDERLMRDLREAGYTPEETVRRIETGLAILFTAPGVTMVYGGQEWGEDTPKKVGPNPLHWDYLDQPLNRRLYESFTTLAHLRTGHPALRTGAISIRQADESSDVIVYERRLLGDAVVVTANLGSEEQRVTVNVPFDGEWLDVLRKRPVDADEMTLNIVLTPGGARVFSGSIFRD